MSHKSIPPKYLLSFFFVAIITIINAQEPFCDAYPRNSNKFYIEGDNQYFGMNNNKDVICFTDRVYSFKADKSNKIDQIPDYEFHDTIYNQEGNIVGGYSEFSPITPESMLHPSISQDHAVWKTSGGGGFLLDLQTQELKKLGFNGTLGWNHRPSISEDIVVWSDSDSIFLYQISNPVLGGTIITENGRSNTPYNYFTVKDLQIENDRYVVWATEEYDDITGEYFNGYVYLYDMLNPALGNIQLNTIQEKITNLSVDENIIHWTAGTANTSEIKYYDLNSTQLGVLNVTQNNLRNHGNDVYDNQILYIQDAGSPLVSTLYHLNLSPGQVPTRISEQSVILQPQIFKNFITWYAYDEAGQYARLYLFDLNKQNIGPQAISYEITNEALKIEFDGEYIVWHSDYDNEIRTYHVTSLVDLDNDGYCAPYDCNDNDANIYPGKPCNDNNVNTVQDRIQNDCSCHGVALNYSCDDAIRIPLNQLTKISSIGSNSGILSATCSGEDIFGNSSWYYFETPYCNGASEVVIGVTNSIYNNITVELFNGPCHEISNLHCNNETIINGKANDIIVAHQTLQLSCNTRYYFRLYEPGVARYGETEIYINLIGPSEQDDCQHPDYPALLSLYNSMVGNAWDLNQGWLSNCDPCSWHGITCNDDNRVTALDMVENALSGEIPHDIEDMTELIRLNLSNSAQNIEHLGNTIQGSIPIELGKLKNLTTLNLKHNLLSGQIPPELGRARALSFLDLSNNQLSGQIPGDLGQLDSLKYWYLYNNNLEGCIDDGLYLLCDNVEGVSINYLNNLDAQWSEFCSCGTGVCACDEEDFNVWIHGPGQWSNLQNWSKNRLPQPCDHVLLFFPGSEAIIEDDHAPIIYNLEAKQETAVTTKNNTEFTILGTNLANWLNCTD